MCYLNRVSHCGKMKLRQKLTKSKFGFMVLKSPFLHVIGTFFDSFTRFNTEEYLQTVLTSDMTGNIYNFFFKNANEIRENDDYKLLSQYFKITSKLGGVSISFFSLHPWQD